MNIICQSIINSGLNSISGDTFYRKDFTKKVTPIEEPDIVEFILNNMDKDVFQPNPYDVFYKTGRVFEKNGDYNIALKFYEKAKQAIPKSKQKEQQSISFDIARVDEKSSGSSFERREV